MHESESEVARSRLTLRDPIVDCSPPGSSVHGIFQASVLEWGAIAFSIISLAEFKMYFIFYPINISGNEGKQRCLRNSYKLKA